jgi:hypothetical protein
LVQISVQDHVQFGDIAFACTDIASRKTQNMG